MYRCIYVEMYACVSTSICIQTHMYTYACTPPCAAATASPCSDTWRPRSANFVVIRRGSCTALMVTVMQLHCDMCGGPRLYTNNFDAAGLPANQRPVCTRSDHCALLRRNARSTNTYSNDVGVCHGTPPRECPPSANLGWLCPTRLPQCLGPRRYTVVLAYCGASNRPSMP